MTIHSIPYPVNALGAFSYHALAFSAYLYQPISVVAAWMLSTLAVSTQHIANIYTEDRGERGISLGFLTQCPMGSGRTRCYETITEAFSDYEEHLQERHKELTNDYRYYDSLPAGVKQRLSHVPVKPHFYFITFSPQDVEPPFKKTLYAQFRDRAQSIGLFDHNGLSINYFDFDSEVPNLLDDDTHRISLHLVRSQINKADPYMLHTLTNPGEFMEKTRHNHWGENPNQLLASAERQDFALMKEFYNIVKGLISTRPDLDQQEHNYRILGMSENATYKWECVLGTKGNMFSPFKCDNEEPGLYDFCLERLKENTLRLAAVLTLAHDPQATIIHSNAIKNAVTLAKYYHANLNALMSYVPK